MLFHLRRPFYLFLNASVATIAISSHSAWAADLHGAVEKKDGIDQTSPVHLSPGKPLEGSLKSDDSLKSSLKVIPQSATPSSPLNGGVKSNFLPGDITVTQYRGSALSGPGQNAPAFTPANGVWSSQSYFGVIPPISSYTLTPRNGITTYAPGFEAGVPGSGNSFNLNAPGISSATQATQSDTIVSYKGVTSYVPGTQSFTLTQSVSSMSRAAYQDNYRVIVGRGVVSYAPGSESYTVSSCTATTYNGITSYTPGHEVTLITCNRGVTNWQPGSSADAPGNSFLTPRSSDKGVAVYSQGYEIPVAKAGWDKETLGGIWWSGIPVKSPPAGLEARANRLPQTDAIVPSLMLTEAVVPENPTPLLAKALLLPEAQETQTTGLNWDQWYKRVAKAIYARWKNYEVGPGSAVVRVIVNRSRDVNCEVVSFTACPDVERDPAAEAEFRESAVRSVKLVSNFEIPEFPQGSDKDKVSFEVEMKRLVSSQTGFTVASH